MQQLLQAYGHFPEEDGLAVLYVFCDWFLEVSSSVLLCLSGTLTDLFTSSYLFSHYKQHNQSKQSDL